MSRRETEKTLIRIIEKYDLTNDLTIKEALNRITDSQDLEDFYNCMKYPNGKPSWKEDWKDETVH